MFEKVIPILAALIALQILLRIMQKKRSQKAESDWKKIDYKKRLDLFLKGKKEDNITQDVKGITLIGIEDFRAIQDDKRDLRRAIFLIKDAVAEGIKAKIGRDSIDKKFINADKMFDEIVEVIKKYQKKEDSN